MDYLGWILPFFVVFYPFRATFFLAPLHTVWVRDAKWETNRKDRYSTICSANWKTLSTVASGWCKVHCLKIQHSRFFLYLHVSVLSSAMGVLSTFKLEQRHLQQEKKKMTQVAKKGCQGRRKCFLFISNRKAWYSYFCGKRCFVQQKHLLSIRIKRALPCTAAQGSAKED